MSHLAQDTRIAADDDITGVLLSVARNSNNGTPASIDAMVRRVAAYYNGHQGEWVYRGFDYINAMYFDGRLPTPLIIWTITPYGHCIGETRMGRKPGPDEPPVVVLHPVLFKWGDRYAFDTLLHECMHVHINANLGGHTGETSHNSDEWISEVNRLAPLLGIPGVQAGRTKVRRVPVPGAEPNERGKVPTMTTRVTEGNIPHKAIAGFPDEVRKYLGLTDYYRERSLPFE